VWYANRTGLWAAEQKWKKTKLLEDPSCFHSLLSTFSSFVSTAKAASYHSKFQASTFHLKPGKLFSTFSSLLNPSPLSSLSADDFAK
jgi:hypothetical protein